MIPDATTIEAPRPVRQDRSQQTRERILEEALRLFAERGYDGVGVRDIAAAVGVNHGLIKYHFGDKTSLWKAAVARLFERTDREAVVPEDMRDRPLVERFAIFLREYVRYCARHPEHARLMVQESVRDSERLAWAAETYIQPEHHRVIPAIEELIRQGRMVDIDPVHLIYMISSAAQAPFMLAPELKHVHGREILSDAAVETHADAVVALFLR